ncbi:MAG: enolase C-terminal domain-like protein [Actinomycetota bacterium]
MIIERVTLRLLDLPLVEPFRTAHGSTTTRQIVVARVDTDRGHGWGECSALPEPTYTAEYALGAFVTISEHLAPLLLAPGVDVDGSTIAAALSPIVGHPMAKAGLEMAVLDAELRHEEISLATHLRTMDGGALGAPGSAGPGPQSVPAGAALGLVPLDTVGARVEQLAAAGFGRIKVKIEPGADLSVVEAARAAVPGIDLQVDANGSFADQHRTLVAEIAHAGVSAIEQPFSPEAVDLAAELVATAPVPIVADEAAPTADHVADLVAAGAASGVSIKPARLGGITAALDLVDRCRSWGLAATAGGMIECGLGRHALIALSALDTFSITGDLSPGGRWLAADPWPDVTMTNGAMTVPRGPGVAPEPDPDVLDRFTVRAVTISR